jgi:hypothetical protein
MNFERYLAQKRKYKLRVNPSTYADEFRDELDYHVKNVVNWINGDANRDRMIGTMKFFGTRFAASGRVYRGTEYYPRFDGKPASYTKSLEIAEDFGRNDAQSHWFFDGDKFYVIERNAPANSIDVGRMLKSYTGGEFAKEKEVIMFNTPVGDRNVALYELE